MKVLITIAFAEVTRRLMGVAARIGASQPARLWLLLVQHVADEQVRLPRTMHDPPGLRRGLDSTVRVREPAAGPERFEATRERRADGQCEHGVDAAGGAMNDHGLAPPELERVVDSLKRGEPRHHRPGVLEVESLGQVRDAVGAEHERKTRATTRRRSAFSHVGVPLPDARGVRRDQHLARGGYGHRQGVDQKGAGSAERLDRGGAHGLGNFAHAFESRCSPGPHSGSPQNAMAGDGARRTEGKDGRFFSYGWSHSALGSTI
jgi:hypothetical protein